MGCDIIVTCPDPTTHMLLSWGKSSAVPSCEQGKMLHEFSEQFASHEYKESVHISGPILPIFHQCINLKKFILARKHIEGSNNDYTSIIKNKQKDVGPLSRSTSGAQKQPLCGLSRGTEAGKIWVKSPGPFICPLLTIILLFIYLTYIWSLSWFMVQASWNSWNLLSLIDHETTQGKTSGSGLSAKNLNTHFEVGNFTTFLPAPLGRGAGSEIKINEQWPLIQSKWLSIENLHKNP